MNEEHRRRYAQLLVRRGVGLRPGQPLYVYGQVAHCHLMALLTEGAYQAGGGRVETRLFDPLQLAALVRHGRLEDIELCHTGDQAFLNGVTGGEAMSSRELESLGVNHSTIHTDVMFGSTSVRVVATESREGEVVLIDRGRWAVAERPRDCRVA